MGGITIIRPGQVVRLETARTGKFASLDFDGTFRLSRALNAEGYGATGRSTDTVHCADTFLQQDGIPVNGENAVMGFQSCLFSGEPSITPSRTI